MKVAISALVTLYGDGTTHVIFDALDFIGRLAVLMPRARVNETQWRWSHVRSAPSGS